MHGLIKYYLIQEIQYWSSAYDYLNLKYLGIRAELVRSSGEFKIATFYFLKPY